MGEPEDLDVRGSLGLVFNDRNICFVFSNAGRHRVSRE
jgi:hypothetical protein